MAYLAVNKDGQELISDYPMHRNGNYKHYMSCFPAKCDKCPNSGYRTFCPFDETGRRYKLKTYSEPPRMEKAQAVENLHFWDNFELDPDCDKIDYTVKIPKGSIKKLIGREMTWEDEPIEI